MVGTDFDAGGLFAGQRLRGGCGDAGENPIPICAQRRKLGSVTILALEEFLADRYAECGIEFGGFGVAERLSCAEFFGDGAQQAAQPLQGGQRCTLARSWTEVPAVPERGEPVGVVEAVGAVAEAVPFEGVGEIDPGSDFAEAMGAEDVFASVHGNELNYVDSLQRIRYSR